MTEEQFTQRIEGLVNDFQNAELTRKELFDGIMDTCINLAKPLQRTIEEQSNLLKRQIAQNMQLTAKHESLVKGLKEIPIYDKKEMEWAVDGTKWILTQSIDKLLTEEGNV